MEAVGGGGVVREWVGGRSDNFNSLPHPDSATCCRPVDALKKNVELAFRLKIGKAWPKKDPKYAQEICMNYVKGPFLTF